MENQPKIEIPKTNKSKKKLIVDNKYKLNRQNLLKDGTSNYKCIYYKKITNAKHFLK